MKRTIYLLILIAFISSCKGNKEKAVIETSSEFEVLNEELLTNFPGGIYLLDKGVVWFDPFSKELFLHYMDKDTGAEISSFGNIGQGPNEFVSPVISDIIWNNNLYVSDANGNNKGYFSLNKQEEDDATFIKLTKEDSLIRSKGYNIRLENNVYIGINKENENGPYKLYGQEETYFGKYVLPNEKKHSNTILLYNSDKQLLISGSTAVNYFSCYKKEKDNFNLVWENRENYEYNIKDGRVAFDRSKKGIFDMAVTKDFIVAIQRDYENDPTDESKVGRNIGKLPQTLFVYDYDGNLIKVINYNVPVGRITGDINTNTIYAIYAEPDFKFGKTVID